MFFKSRIELEMYRMEAGKACIPRLEFGEKRGHSRNEIVSMISHLGQESSDNVRPTNIYLNGLTSLYNYHSRLLFS